MSESVKTFSREILYEFCANFPAKEEAELLSFLEKMAWMLVLSFAAYHLILKAQKGRNS